jgi:cytochrome c biogenesis protein CcdA
MVECTPTSWYRYWLWNALSNIFVGTLVLVAAVIFHDLVSMLLVVLGAVLVLLGLHMLKQGRETARSAQLADGALTLELPKGTRSLLLADIIEMRRGRADFGPIRIRTTGGGTLMLTPHLREIEKLRLELRRQGPNIDLGEF